MTFAAPGTREINLLKIHGALDIFTFNDGKDVLKLRPSTAGVSGVLAALKEANENLTYMHLGKPVYCTNEIAYADDNGEMQFLRRSLLAGAFKFERRFSQVMPAFILKQFSAKLNHLSKLICIGYSFGDTHINEIIRDWLRFESARSLEIVDPGRQQVPAPLLHLSPQISLHNMGTTDYLERFSSTPLTATERFYKKLRSENKRPSR